MRIFIAIDGSDSSREALKIAARMFPSGHSLTLVHIASDIHQADSLLSRTLSREGISSMQAAVNDQAQTLLRASQDWLRDHQLSAGLKLLYGHPVEQLCKFTEEEHADLIMMGKRGLNPLKSFFLGRISDGILRSSKTSILLVPQGASPAEPLPSSQGLRLLVGHDASPFCQLALETLKKWRLQNINDLCFASILSGDAYTYGMANALEQIESNKNHATEVRSSLAQVCDEFKKVMPPSTAVRSAILTEASDVSAALSQFAEDQHADAIVVGSKGRSTFERIALGSVANKLAHHSLSPLLILR